MIKLNIENDQLLSEVGKELNSYITTCGQILTT